MVLKATVPRQEERASIEMRSSGGHVGYPPKIRMDETPSGQRNEGAPGNRRAVAGRVHDDTGVVHREVLRRYRSRTRIGITRGGRTLAG
jgi:hypothetical protein